jgi:hypothetical protein
MTSSHGPPQEVLLGAKRYRPSSPSLPRPCVGGSAAPRLRSVYFPRHDFGYRATTWPYNKLRHPSAGGIDFFARAHRSLRGETGLFCPTKKCEMLYSSSMTLVKQKSRTRPRKFAARPGDGSVSLLNERDGLRSFLEVESRRCSSASGPPVSYIADKASNCPSQDCHIAEVDGAGR